ncbi:unnamed protein product, partial [Amoebophrya sp. A25]|eukprot:GSA25T00002014001.1
MRRKTESMSESAETVGVVDEEDGSSHSENTVGRLRADATDARGVRRLQRTKTQADYDDKRVLYSSLFLSRPSTSPSRAASLTQRGQGVCTSRGAALARRNRMAESWDSTSRLSTSTARLIELSRAEQQKTKSLVRDYKSAPSLASTG